MQEYDSTLEGPDIDEVVDELCRLVPGDWTAGTMVCLFKGKGSHSNPAAPYWGISLLSSVEKIVSAVLLALLRRLADERILQNQAGFRPKKSCRDAVFAVWRSLEEDRFSSRPAILTFYDYTLIHCSGWRMASLSLCRLPTAVDRRHSKLVCPGVKVSRNAPERLSGARKFRLGAFQLQNYLISQPERTFLGPSKL